MCPTLIRWFETKPALFSYYWGFLPAWSKEAKGPGGMRPINARIEGAATNGMFRHAWTHQRCLIPADAFYEWVPVPGHGKQRYCLRRRDHEPMMFAGLWDIWRPREGGEDILRTASCLRIQSRRCCAPAPWELFSHRQRTVQRKRSKARLLCFRINFRSRLIGDVCHSSPIGQVLDHKLPLAATAVPFSYRPRP